MTLKGIELVFDHYLYADGRRVQAVRNVSTTPRFRWLPADCDYQRRREALQQWCLDPGTWEEITSRLPSVPGQRRPVTGDRKRQEASAFTWALVTQGETRFAPRPIEASRPEPVRREWADRHSSTQWKLASSGRIHCAGLQPQEAATALGLAPGTVRMRLLRARGRLRKQAQSRRGAPLAPNDNPRTRGDGND